MSGYVLLASHKCMLGRGITTEVQENFPSDIRMKVSFCHFSCTWFPLGPSIFCHIVTIITLCVEYANALIIVYQWPDPLACKQFIQSVPRAHTKGLISQSLYKDVIAAYGNDMYYWYVKLFFYLTFKKKKSQHGNENNNKRVWYEILHLYTMMESLFIVKVSVAMATKWQHGYLCIIVIVNYFSR